MPTPLTPLQLQALAAFDRTFGGFGDFTKVETIEQAQQNGDPLLPYVLAQCTLAEGVDENKRRLDAAALLDQAGRHLQRVEEEMRVGEVHRVGTPRTIADRADATLRAKPRG